jgi:serine protease AprX
MNDSKKIKIFIPILLCFVFIGGIFAQDKYWVVFSNKKGTRFDPYTYFDKKSIERRRHLGIALADSSDFPLNENYIEQVGAICKITGKSRWLNAVSILAGDDKLNKVRNLACVKEVFPIATISKSTSYTYGLQLNAYEEELLVKQIEVMDGFAFVDKKVTGKGIRIAIFDGGFPKVDKSPVFEHIRQENRIINTYDFVKDKPFVYAHSAHGTMVMACIAGKNGGQNIGLATGAEFLLARTETWTEFFSEEENWLEAAEWADKNGADIISSSLGYTYHRYFTNDMDGQTSLVVKAANMAASKGILVVNAMGNDGGKKWKIMCTPADGDSILAVGGVDPELMYHMNFSSYGPSVDGRMKPNLCAFAKVVTGNKKQLTTAYGTSFSTPLVAGFAACAWELNPDWSNMQLMDELQQSGNLYPYFDYAHGYGIPQAGYFTGEQPDTADMFRLIQKNDSLVVYIPEKNIRKTVNLNDNLYYHAEGPSGKLERYFVIDVIKENALVIDISNLNKDIILRFHFNGVTKEFRKLTKK